jgi:hypothetical protein
MALSGAVVAATFLNPSLQRSDWRALGRLVAAVPHAGLILTEPRTAVKPLHYFLGEPLAPLQPARFPCGVRSRTIVAISRHRARPDPGYGFRLVSSRRAPGGWIVDAFTAPSPRPLDDAGLRALRILGPRAGVRVDAPTPAAAAAGAPDPARTTRWSRWLRDAAPARVGPASGPRSRRVSAVGLPPDWPPPGCPLINPKRLERALI